MMFSMIKMHESFIDLNIKLIIKMFIKARAKAKAKRAAPTRPKRAGR